MASLKGRIQALSFAHDQVVRGEGGGGLSDLVAAELTPYRNASNNIRLADDGVWLDSRAYSVMALVLHEMATNAAKYGALSSEAGTVTLDWELHEEGADRTLRMTWTEAGGPEVTAPVQRGFGSRLIERSARDQLGGEATVDFLPGGVVYTVTCALEDDG